MSMKKLENKATLQILLFLNKHGKMKVTDIKIDAGSGTVYRALDTLADLELIEEERVRPFTRYIQLTREGEAAANALKEIDDIFEAKKARLKRARAKITALTHSGFPDPWPSN